jgi:long-chain fatty acid transport protein
VTSTLQSDHSGPCRVLGSSNLLCLLVGGVALLSATPRVAWAAGFAITAQGAAATGKSSAFTAQADDPSALYYNPAGIARLPGTALLVGSSVILPHTDYQPVAGRTAREEPRAFLVPHLYLIHSLPNGLTAGLGVFTPFGLSTDWPEDWDGRFQVTHVSVQTLTANPAMAWKPLRWLAVGAGASASYVKIEQRRALNLAVFGPTTPEGAVSLEGNAIGLGLNAGLLMIPSDQWSLGFSIRSRVHAEVKHGRADFTVPGSVPPIFSDGSFRTELDLPPSIRAGLLVRPLPEWNVEVDAAWTGWSTIDRLNIEFSNGLSPDRTDFLWGDSMTYSIGTEYRGSSVRARAGYTYDATPIPDGTINPLLPDGNRQWVAVGLGAEQERWIVDGAYQLALFERTKDNAIGDRFNSTVPAIDARANGRYRTRAHVFGVSVAYRF